MMDAERLLRRMVDPGDYAADEESLLAYSYDASGLEGRPLAVLKPRDEEQLRRILVHANQYRLPVVPRGAGTGIRGGCVKEGAVVLDMRHFATIERLDTQRHTVDVGAGVTVRELNAALAKRGYRFPLVPEDEEATIGGLASQNHVTEESFLVGDYHDVVEQAACFDALGRHHLLKDADLSKGIGTEGVASVLLTLRVKVLPTHKLTADVFPAKDATAALDALDGLPKKGVLLAEYLDAEAARLLKLEGPCLLVAYANDGGSYKDKEYVETLLSKRKGLEKTLWAKGLAVEEAALTREQLPAFLGLCEKERWVCFGHLGGGILLAAVERTERETFWNKVIALGALPGGKQGFGRLKREYVPQDVKKMLLKLKEERDYNNILNPGVLV